MYVFSRQLSCLNQFPLELHFSIIMFEKCLEVQSQTRLQEILESRKRVSTKTSIKPFFLIQKLNYTATK